MNLVPGTVREVRVKDVLVGFGQRTLTARHPADVDIAVGDEVRICVRPEALGLRGSHTEADELVLPGIVARRAFLGDLMRYWVRIDEREWIVDQPDPGASTPFDGPVAVTVRPERVHLIKP